jgi:hypothetical protein
LLYNRITSRFLNDVLKTRGWSRSKLAKLTGLSRSVISEHFAGDHRIRLVEHLVKYLDVLNHQEQTGLFSAWLRDNCPPVLVQHLLNGTGDDLGRDVKEFVPPLDVENKRRLAWLAREIARDKELDEVVSRFSAMAGYRPRRTAVHRAKRGRRR